MFVMTKRQLVEMMDGLSDDAPVVVYAYECGQESFGTPAEACVTKMRKDVVSRVDYPGMPEFAGWHPDPQGVECLVIGWTSENG